MTKFPDGFDVEGPVQAELFVVWLAGDHLELTGPCGPAPWLLELGPTDHPVEVVTRIVRDMSVSLCSSTRPRGDGIVMP